MEMFIGAVPVCFIHHACAEKAAAKKKQADNGETAIKHECPLLPCDADLIVHQDKSAGVNQC